MRIASLSLVALLGLGGSFWAITGAIAPPLARAYTSRVNITLDRQPNESFATLVRRAEAVARAAAQRSFDNDILVSEAAIVITGQNIGLSAPILTLEVSRDGWTRHPDSKRWSTYYPNSKQLLRIDDPTPVAAATPQAGQRPEPTLGTGVIQNTLRWSTTDDLDLEVIDPSGQRVFFQNKKVASGGELDVDSNAGCQNTITNPVENIFWPSTGAPPGNYTVRVNLYERCATRTGPIPFRLRLLAQGSTQELTGNVDDANRTLNFRFALPPAGSNTPVQLPTGPSNNAATGTQPSPRPNNAGGTPANRQGNTNQRRTPATNTGGTTNNRRGSTNQRTNTPNNRSGNTNQRTNSTGNTRTTPANRTTNAPANRTATPATNSNNQPSNANTCPPGTTASNRSQPSYGTGLVRRARELQGAIDNRNRCIPNRQ